MATRPVKENPLHQSLDPAISKGLYTVCYYLAFGTVYASCVVMDLVPEDSSIRHGLRDGAEAARQSWAGTREEDEVAESEMQLPKTPGEPTGEA